MAEKQDLDKHIAAIDHNETISSLPEKFQPTAKSHDPILEAFTEADIRRVRRKIDIRLIPICGLMYCVSLLDRTNLSNAAIAGYVMCPNCLRSTYLH